MPQLIKDGALAADSHVLIRGSDAPPVDEPAIVPLATWKAHRDTLRAKKDVAVWLGPADDPAEIADDVATLALVAVDFPQFTDGRGYSIGRLLRDRYGFKGELRAIGDVAKDQLYYLSQCGFNAFSIREDRDAAEALAGLSTFSDGYQLTHARTPWFRRRPAASREVRFPVE